MKSNMPLPSELNTNWQKLIQMFISPEDEISRATLVKHMGEILFELQDFLKKNVGVTEEISLLELSKKYQDTIINVHPKKKLAEVITAIIKDIAPQAVNVSSPYFVGHMTSAIPFFMVHLKSIVAALNQNVVKLETSKVVSLLERQVIAKIHRLIFNFNETFYRTHVQSISTTLGVFIEGGTSANLTALWIARNTVLGPKENFNGIEEEGILAAYKAYDIDRCVVLVSRRGHYSLRKAGGLLGIGNKNIIALDIDKNHQVDIECLKRKIEIFINDKRTKIIAIIGIAGATETGTVDPLVKIGKICQKHKIYFHVDAAWGGPTLFSEKYKHLLKGIEHADSVTIDGHKQFYMPMTCGMVYFKNPESMESIAYFSNYVNRRGSVDLGIKSFSGSREANSLILDSALKIMGKKGYSLLIEHGLELAQNFADEIEKRNNFQMITRPKLNILTYRYCPSIIQEKLKTADTEQQILINKELNELNITLQRLQREAGNSFVSRTQFLQDNNPNNQIVILRSVLMNPLTNIRILNDILDEQERIVNSTTELKKLFKNYYKNS